MIIMEQVNDIITSDWFSESLVYNKEIPLNDDESFIICDHVYVFIKEYNFKIYFGSFNNDKEKWDALIIMDSEDFNFKSYYYTDTNDVYTAVYNYLKYRRMSLSNLAQIEIQFLRTDY